MFRAAAAFLRRRQTGKALQKGFAVLRRGERKVLRGEIETEVCEPFGQRLRILCISDRKVIAGLLAVIINTLADIMYGRMVEQNRLDRGLRKIDQIVMTADMGDFMQQYGFDLTGGQAREKAGRDQYNRLEKSQRHRTP